MVDETQVEELAAGVTDPNGWEPATFVMTCPAGHRWDSRGSYHAASRTNAPNQPTCPRDRCGRLAELTLAAWGPNRPGVVEAWKR